MLPVPLVPDGRTIRQDLSGPNRTPDTAIFIPVTNMLERLNEEIRRRTHVVRIFPNGESCLRLVRALAVETHENWLEQHRYLTWTTYVSTRRRHCDAQPDRRPVPSTVLARPRTLRAGSAGAHRVRGGILDCRCARRSAERQVGTKGWSFRSNKGMLLY